MSENDSRERSLFSDRPVGGLKNKVISLPVVPEDQENPMIAIPYQQPMQQAQMQAQMQANLQQPQP